MKKIAVLCLTLALLLGASNQANAWSQTFNESGVNFNRLDIFALVNDATIDGLSGFTNPSWEVDTAMPFYYSASGNSTNNMNFDLYFRGTKPVSFDFFALNDNAIVDAARIIYRGGPVNFGWDITGIRNAAAVFESDYNSAMAIAPVPESNVMTLLSIGLIAFSLVLRKRGSFQKNTCTIGANC